MNTDDVLTMIEIDAAADALIALLPAEIFAERGEKT